MFCSRPRGTVTAIMMALLLALPALTVSPPNADARQNPRAAVEHVEVFVPSCSPLSVLEPAVAVAKNTWSCSEYQPMVLQYGCGNDVQCLIDTLGLRGCVSHACIEYFFLVALDQRIDIEVCPDPDPTASSGCGGVMIVWS